MNIYYVPTSYLDHRFEKNPDEACQFLMVCLDMGIKFTPTPMEGLTHEGLVFMAKNLARCLKNEPHRLPSENFMPPFGE